MTPNMRRFIEKNKSNKIVYGEHVTAEGKPIQAMSESAGVEYRFDDHSKIFVSKADVQSAPAFTPVWQID